MERSDAKGLARLSGPQDCNSASTRTIGLWRPLETRQENSGGSPHRTLQLPNARARTRASSNAGRAGRSRTHLGLRVQSGGAAVVGQRASNQYMTRAFSLSDITSLPHLAGHDFI